MIRMLRWMCGVMKEWCGMWKDRIRNESLKGTVGVQWSVEEMKDNKARWFGYVMRRHNVMTYESLEAVRVTCYRNKF